ncbi:InlB B-repeat-containing protein [Rhodohalobacter sp.]|uniref:InlB B-repeat-containing protein n=1 Tax=Rhodohalobacter sp. TaxID=1974210 RepID=UPI002ACE4E3B|nr:hypothetical protein [Rhodohalobacter sp.]MDZ7757103.1 hypothetical protein [Rhodohalobacter sp.]
MKRSNIIGILLCIMLITAGCGTTDSGDDGDDPPVTTTYTLSTTASPQQGGSVTPSSGTFDENENVSVSAQANDGWVFDSWTGDIQSTDNPLNFSITANTSLTANFTDVSSLYVADLTATNGPDQIVMSFGQQQDPSSVEAPPVPPEGAFHTWFVRDEENLFTDILDQTLTQVSWQLNLQPGDEDIVNLEWNIDVEKANGTLTLTDQSETFSVDMFSESSYQIDASQMNVLIIEYELQVD